MEPFGLFQLLQSLLPKPEQTNAENTAEQTPDEPISQEIETPVAQTDENQRAYLSFMQAHESRAKRLRKP